MKRKNANIALLTIAAGFTIWAVAFAVIYSSQALGCRFGWHMMELGLTLTVQRVQLVVLTLAALALSAVAVHRLKPDQAAGPAGFLQTIAYRGAIAGSLACVLTFAAVFVLSPC